MNWPRISPGSVEFLMITTLSLMAVSMVSSLERDLPQDYSRYPSRRLASTLEFYPRRFQFYNDMEPWKRAPSAGWFGMRGKKVPGSNFFGMRGKKGPSGFLGMRGKKMDPYPVENGNEAFAPVESLEDTWALEQEGQEGDRSPNPRELQLLNTVKANIGKINI